MNNLEKIIKEYSSKKLLEIVDDFSNSYSENFIDYAKDELIRRGEIFSFSKSLEDEIKLMSDESLRNLVENDWNNYHLEYVEIARIEYLKRNFKNDSTENHSDNVSKKKEKYPALNGVIIMGQILAWGSGIIFILLAIYTYNKNDDAKLSIAFLFTGITLFVFYLATSESIKVIIDIEKNTRIK